MDNQRIIYPTPDGGVAIIVPAPGVSAADVLKDVPPGVVYEIVDVATIPSDRTFRNAWEKAGNQIQHNLTKAKEIAHEKRRIKRAEEFAPLDIESTIPAKAAGAEAARQLIRDKYAAMQVAIDAAADVDALKSAAAEVL